MNKITLRDFRLNATKYLESIEDGLILTIYGEDKYLITSLDGKNVLTDETPNVLTQSVSHPKAVTMENVKEVVKELKMAKVEKKLNAKQQLAEDLMSGDLKRDWYKCYVPFCAGHATERDKFGHWLCPDHI